MAVTSTAQSEAGTWQSSRPAVITMDVPASDGANGVQRRNRGSGDWVGHRPRCCSHTPGRGGRSEPSAEHVALDSFGSPPQRAHRPQTRRRPWVAREPDRGVRALESGDCAR